MGETAGLLLVARPHCVLVDDGPEPSSRRHPLGHVVRRWQVLSGESWGLAVAWQGRAGRKGSWSRGLWFWLGAWFGIGMVGGGSARLHSVCAIGGSP